MSAITAPVCVTLPPDAVAESVVAVVAPNSTDVPCTDTVSALPLTVALSSAVTARLFATDAFTVTASLSVIVASFDAVTFTVPSSLFALLSTTSVPETVAVSATTAPV